jgi:hypothetical protein
MRDNDMALLSLGLWRPGALGQSHHNPQDRMHYNIAPLSVTQGVCRVVETLQDNEVIDVHPK